MSPKSWVCFSWFVYKIFYPPAFLNLLFKDVAFWGRCSRDRINKNLPRRSCNHVATSAMSVQRTSVSKTTIPHSDTTLCDTLCIPPTRCLKTPDSNIPTPRLISLGLKLFLNCPRGILRFQESNANFFILRK